MDRIVVTTVVTICITSRVTLRAMMTVVALHIQAIATDRRIILAIILVNETHTETRTDQRHSRVLSFHTATSRLQVLTSIKHGMCAPSVLHLVVPRGMLASLRSIAMDVDLKTLVALLSRVKGMVIITTGIADKAPVVM